MVIHYHGRLYVYLVKAVNFSDLGLSGGLRGHNLSIIDVFVIYDMDLWVCSLWIDCIVG